MRVAVPALKIGKSGGYRVIYGVQLIDEIQYVVFLQLYFKGDQADLSDEQYKDALSVAAHILGNVLEFDWE